MKGLPLRTFAIAGLAATCFVCVAAARAQETWDQTGGASSWQAGSAKTAIPATRATAPGSSVGWSAGRGSFAHGVQHGGVWRDSSTLSETTTKIPARGLAVRTTLDTGQLSVAGLNRMSGMGNGTVVHAKGQETTLPSRMHSATGAIGSRSQLGDTGLSVHRVASGRRGATGRRTGLGHGHSKSDSSTMATALTNLSSPMRTDSVLRPLTPRSPLEVLNSELHATGQGSSH
jgi:hypothetical protein